MFIKLTHKRDKFSYLIPANQIERVTESFVTGGCTVILKENKTVEVKETIDEIHAQLQQKEVTHTVIPQQFPQQYQQGMYPPSYNYTLSGIQAQLLKENEELAKQLKETQEELKKRNDFLDVSENMLKNNKAYQEANLRWQIEQEEAPQPSPEQLKAQSDIDLAHLQRAMGLAYKKPMKLEQMYDWCRNHRQYRGYLFLTYQSDNQVSKFYDENHKLISSLPNKQEQEEQS